MSLYSWRYKSVELMNIENSISFSSSISSVDHHNNDFSKYGRRSSQSELVRRLKVTMQEITKSSSKSSVNGRAIKVVATTSRKLLKKERVINGSVVKTLPSSYDCFTWTNEDYNVWQRTMNVWSFVLSLVVRVLTDNAKWSYMSGFTQDKQKSRRKRTASWLREQILELGPTFIKLGQFASTRSDLFYPEIVDELTKLQDKVPAFSPEEARSVIESELGAPVNLLFKEFENQPIAAASVGQVHRATLHNGEKVIVKVQRRGLKKLFDIDLRNLNSVAEFFQQSETFGRTTDWLCIYEECSKTLYKEIDYINEAKNAERFRRDFRNIKWVRVPVVFWDYTSARVLTLEYLPGIKIDQLDMLDSKGYSRSRIASRATEAGLIQILKTGFFHADPHPGNLAVDVDEALIFYDFGMMAEINSFTQRIFTSIFNAVYQKDADKVIQSLVELKAIEPTKNMSSLRKTVQYLLDKLATEYDPQVTLASIAQDIMVSALEQQLRFPATITFVMKAFSTLEGIGFFLDPEFSFAKIAASYAQELLESREKQTKGTQVLHDIRKQAEFARSYTISMPYKVGRIEEFVKKLESGDLKLRVQRKKKGNVGDGWAAGRRLGAGEQELALGEELVLALALARQELALGEELVLVLARQVLKLVRQALVLRWVLLDVGSCALLDAWALLVRQALAVLGAAGRWCAGGALLC